MCFINQYIELLTVHFKIMIPANRLKLVDQCCNNQISFVFQNCLQPFSGCSPNGGHLRIGKVIPDLFVKVDSVRDNNEARVLVCLQILDFFDQHDHRQRFPTALSMPDNSTCGILPILAVDALDRVLNGKKLLMSADFLDVAVI